MNIMNTMNMIFFFAMLDYGRVSCIVLIRLVMLQLMWNSTSSRRQFCFGLGGDDGNIVVRNVEVRGNGMIRVLLLCGWKGRKTYCYGHERKHTKTDRLQITMTFS